MLRTYPAELTLLCLPCCTLIFLRPDPAVLSLLCPYFSAHLPCCAYPAVPFIFLRTYPAVVSFFCALPCCVLFVRALTCCALIFFALTLLCLYLSAHLVTLLCPYFFFALTLLHVYFFLHTYEYPAVPLFIRALALLFLKFFYAYNAGNWANRWIVMLPGCCGLWLISEL